MNELFDLPPTGARPSEPEGRRRCMPSMDWLLEIEQELAQQVYWATGPTLRYMEVDPDEYTHDESIDESTHRHRRVGRTSDP